MPQYLRVRRRRNASTAAMLRLEGLMDPDAVNNKRNRDISREEEAFSGMNLSEDSQTESCVDSSEASLPQRKKMKRSAIWRHVESTTTVPSPTNVQFIDAVLEDDEIATSKRRRTSQKLTLIDTSTISSFAPVETTKKSSYKVLNPLERMVDDSLKEVIAGSKSAYVHWNWCRNDSNFLNDRAKYIQWCGQGNLLHACALWNNTETASELLMWAAAQGSVEMLTQAVDAEGNIPYRTAQLVGHDAVADVIASFGGDDDYVYDVYCLDESPPDDDDSNLSSLAENPEQVKLCHLENGVGYWDEKGELVVEIPAPETGFRPIDQDDGDEDSNSENWDGNDYPDDEESEDSDEEDDGTFRNAAADWS